MATFKMFQADRDKDLHGITAVKLSQKSLAP
jgi:hypothetical protein